MVKRARKYLIYAACAAAVVYAIAVIGHVGSRLELGIDCLLTSDGQADETQPGAEIGFVDLATGDYVGPRPSRGDMILRVADEDAPTFLHLKKRTAALDRNISSLGRSSATAVRSPADLLATPGLPPVVEIDESPWTRIEFVRNGSPREGERPLIAQSWLRLKPASGGVLVPTVLWLVVQMLILGIGALGVWRRPGDPSTVLFFVLSAVYVVTFMGLFHWPSLVGTKALVYPFVACAILLPAMTLHFYLLFPRPVKPIRRHPWLTLSVVYAIPAVWMGTTFAALVRINALDDAGAPVAEQTAALAWLLWLSYGYLAVAMLLFLIGVGVLIYSYLSSRTRAQRNQIRWILGAVLLSALPVAYLLRTAVLDRSEFVYGPTPKAMVYLTSLLFAVAYAVSITRYKLLEVGRLMNRGILYVGISLAATALYCLMVGIVTALVGRYYLRWENAVAAGLTAMTVVVLLVFVRDRFQQALDRRFVREKYRLDTAMRRLSRVVDRLVDPAQLARQLLQSAHDAVSAQRGAVYLHDKGDQAFSLACRLGWPLAPDNFAEDSPMLGELGSGHVLTARHGLAVLPSAGQQQLRDWEAEIGVAVELDGAVLGVLLLGPKDDDTPYSAEDCNFLTALARTTALALNSARGHRTIEALQGKLEATLAKIAEQQQRITFLQGELLGHSVAAKDSRQRDGRAKGPASAPQLLHDVRGSSRVVREMLTQVAKIAGTGSSVLIRGESGTGKELLARAIHNNSPRAAGPFVAVHCAALSTSLLESELFGHTKGAFTGAESDRAGRFELAGGGTLFLDEVGDIAVETQIKLLRVLQEKAFERVGGHETIRTDVRLIAATHRDLEELIRDGRFREDLFYRLNVISLWAPPLRERREDIFELALHFLRVHSQASGKAIKRIDEEAMETLAAYDWPGNVRQLENALEHAVVLADGDSITRADLPPEIAGTRQTRKPARRPQRATVAAGVDGGYSTTPSDPGESLSGELENLERQRLAEALAQTGGNKAKAARLLDMPRSTFFSKLRKLGLG